MSSTAPDVREEPFELEVDGHRVPGIVWRPAREDDRTPLVLAGHGGGFGTAGHKRVDSIVALASLLAEHHGIATVAIDQPGCGDRDGAEEEQARRREMTVEDAIESLWTPALIDAMTADWKATIDHVDATMSLGRDGLGYWGLSGGTTFGLPLVAREPRIGAAVLGLNGAVPLMLTHAPGVTCPVFYMMNLDDHFMTRESSLALFDALATADKRLLAFPGDHGARMDEAIPDWASFFAARLRT